ncbi:LytR/AlgR family response regulator transcription factor [Pedobacter cryotolerans]|uniref:Response regulator transcription factor n=1 Tax=Pedobacter cryotolerans TaxID=2571270 RepID=A0A4U1C656_9SPHI|nr:LytTR family DNA-binding domain-containing protein [Pedobacter cryotolerans]TKC00049.1 response regulator transcription factor [Pedobacter cryotolerans]
MEIRCIIIDDEPHAISELEDLIMRTPGIGLLGSFYNVNDAVRFLNEGQIVDIIFSDIDMPLINGIAAAKILKAYCSNLIYVTAHRNFAIEAFAVNAIGYLLKPVGIEAFVSKISEITLSIRNIKGNSNQDLIFIKGSHKNAFIKLAFSDVIRIEAMLNYVKIFTQKGDEITYVGLKKLEDILKKKCNFFRISKSSIINLDFMDRVDGNVIKMNDGGALNIGEKYRDAFHEFLRKRTLNS